jgi:hypothetical protein
MRLAANLVRFAHIEELEWTMRGFDLVNVLHPVYMWMKQHGYKPVLMVFAVVAVNDFRLIYNPQMVINSLQTQFCQSEVGFEILVKK